MPTVTCARYAETPRPENNFRFPLSIHIDAGR